MHEISRYDINSQQSINHIDIMLTLISVNQHKLLLINSKDILPSLFISSIS